VRPILELRDLAVEFATRDGVVRAVDGVDLAVPRGQTLGIVGESGSGKSVTALSITRLLDPPGRIARGQILLDGEDLVQYSERDLLNVRGKRISMIFQEPASSLNPTVTVGEQLFEALRTDKYDAWRRGALPGLARSVKEMVRPNKDRAATARADAVTLLRSVHLSSPEVALRRYPFMLSGGMLQRIMITIALASRPEILIADEPTTALDVTIQAQILQILRERKAASDLTTVIITHDLGVIAEMCDRVAVMYAGRIIEEASAADLFHAAKHPYTRGLLASMPSIERAIRARRPIEGSVPDLIGLRAESCFFAPRCPLKTDVCLTERPPLAAVSDGQVVACHAYTHPAMKHLSQKIPKLWEEGEVSAPAEPPAADRLLTPLLEARGLTKHFGQSRGVVRAVDGIDFAVWRGETFALVGESGCGKTTTGELVLRLQEPTAGDVLFEGASIVRARGRELRALRKRMQVVFQNPRSSLNPRMRIADILREPLEAHHDARAATKGAVRDLLATVGLRETMSDRYPHEVSGGQAQRVAVARALALSPDLVVLDEPTSALDVSVQTQLIKLLERLQADLRLTYIFISHDLRIVRHFSDRIAVMYLGKIVESGRTQDVFGAPSHPYTQALLSAIPRLDPRAHRERVVLAGEVSSDIPSGCRFRTRCPLATTYCTDNEPPLRPLEDGRMVACHYATPDGTFTAQPVDPLPANLIGG
jgi:oligopeptide/dipeptide ABC transporter ATP-binding protein